MDLKKSISEMKSICKQNGSHYFDPDTIKFWGAKIIDTPNKWGLFIESHDGFYRTKKLYAVKFFAPDGDITTIEPAKIGGTYEHFATCEDARSFRCKLSNALNQASKCYRENKVLETLCKIAEEGINSGIFTLTNTEGETIKINTNNFDRFICG